MATKEKQLSLLEYLKGLIEWKEIKPVIAITTGIQEDKREYMFLNKYTYEVLKYVYNEELNPEYGLIFDENLETGKVYTGKERVVRAEVEKIKNENKYLINTIYDTDIYMKIKHDKALEKVEFLYLFALMLEEDKDLDISILESGLKEKALKILEKKL